MQSVCDIFGDDTPYRGQARSYKWTVKPRPDASLSKISLRRNVASGIVWQIATNCFFLVLINTKR